MAKQLSRRTMLRGAGGLLVGLPVLDAMMSLTGTIEGSAKAESTPDGRPRRVIFFMTGLGYHDSTWVSGRGRGDEFQLSEMLAPLAPVKDKSIFIRGADLRSTIDWIQAHEGGMTSCLTGSHAPAKGGVHSIHVPPPISSSLDVHIEERLQGQVPFPAYRWGTRTVSRKYSDNPFYSKALDAQPSPVVDGDVSFNDLFSDLEPGGGGRPVDQEATLRHLKRERIFDLVGDDLKRLECRLNADDQQRVEQHLAEYEKFLQQSRPGQGGEGCDVPGNQDAIWDQDRHHPEIWGAQLEQIAMALSCDTVRAGFALYGQLTNSDTAVYYNTFLDDRDDVRFADRRLPNKHHHRLSHEDTSGGYYWPMEKISNWHAMELMRLVRRLQEIPEGDGSLFDHTAIVWCNEMGWDHARTGVHHMIIGDGGGYFDVGQSIEYPSSDNNAHNRLLLNVLHCLGIHDETFGEAKYCGPGPFPELIA